MPVESGDMREPATSFNESPPDPNGGTARRLPSSRRRPVIIQTASPCRADHPGGYAVPDRSE